MATAAATSAALLAENGDGPPSPEGINSTGTGTSADDDTDGAARYAGEADAEALSFPESREVGSCSGGKDCDCDCDCDGEGDEVAVEVVVYTSSSGYTPFLAGLRGLLSGWLRVPRLWFWFDLIPDPTAPWLWL
jgi:hypothetical protein